MSSIFVQLIETGPKSNEPRHEKTCFSHMRTTKVQISLRIREVWFSTFVVRYLDGILNTSSFYLRNFKTLACLCTWAGRFESYLVANPEDRFSRDVAQIISALRSQGQILSYLFTLCFDVFVSVRQCKLITWAATWQNQQNECAPSEDSDQPGHPPSLIRVFAVRMKNAWVLSYPLSAQRRLWSDWAYAQAVWVFAWRTLCWFCHVAAHVVLQGGCFDSINLCVIYSASRFWTQFELPDITFLFYSKRRFSATSCCVYSVRCTPKTTITI